MPRTRATEKAKPRDMRLIFYVNSENKKRFRKLYIDMGSRNYEDALMKLLDIYEILSRKLGTTNLDEIKRSLEQLLELRVKLYATGWRLVFEEVTEKPRAYTTIIVQGFAPRTRAR
jgi:hypothetical protein